MNKFLLLAGIATTFFACQEKTGYTISGTVSGAKDGEYVYMSNFDGELMNVVDSAMIKNGKFEFTGTPDSVLSTKYLNYRNDARNLNVMVFVEKGNINVEMSDEDLRSYGTKLNDSWSAFNDKYSDYDRQLGAIELKFRTDSTLTDTQKDSLVEAYDVVMSECMDYVHGQIEENIANPYGVYLLSVNGYSFEVEDVDSLLSMMPEQYLSSKALSRLKNYVENAIKTVPGKKYIDFTMNTPEGKEVKLSDYVSKNKYTLVDFWASWCGPCRKEMPNVVEVYSKFKNKGLEIVGVSLDKDLEKWKSAIKDLKITWPQMSDLKAWECEGASLYTVRAIPATVIIDQEGTIIARNLYGDELFSKLEELLK